MVSPVPRYADIYTEHQAVWANLARFGMSSGEQFLYRWDETGGHDVLHVRTAIRLPASVPARLPAAGTLRVRMVCATRIENRYLPIPDELAVDWFHTALSERGFSGTNISASPFRLLSGHKDAHLITLPCRDFTADYLVTDPEAAWHAFRSGIGRARRFGCGLLAVAVNDRPLLSLKR